ncbi:hypothetical protein [Solitalea koreensis]|uniref:L-rhamnose mutarotase n=1 Tax=Solitalea koreensis TaxID=543615 RepID=A0A521BKG8_9SPHI|nr:hypothetical protein [Solitalea koreensis]SMO47637.1 hypothetical protein SAMN06265350_102274 [Solitalea koreensis]
MILIRNIFQLKFGKAREAKEIWNEGKNTVEGFTKMNYRVLFDLVGDSYTMVLEVTADNLSAFEQQMQSNVGTDAWRNWYQKFIPLCESGRREIFTIVEENKL